MATINLPNNFREFLRSFNNHHVEYLLIGGYAVAYHGYPRSTAVMDIWVAANSVNANRVVAALREFGFDLPELSAELFLKEGQIVRMGVPPLRIEIWTSVSGIRFQESYANRIVDSIEDTELHILDLRHLKINKKAAGRHKDLDDLENLP